jgi:hypothetical protein
MNATLEKLEPGLSMLIEQYKQKTLDSTHTNEVETLRRCVQLLNPLFTSAQLSNLELFVGEHPLESGFGCGSCGFKGTLTIRFNEFQVTFVPKSTSVEAVMKVLKGAFGQDIYTAPSTVLVSSK